MTPLIFNSSNLQVSFRGKTITLLPKEYNLLQFLHLHPNQGFSREALLDAVWPLETPVDRTVDDHIYRLRKKLELWNAYLTIDTVRGVGYRLTFREDTAFHPPSMKDQTFNSQFGKIMTQYHLFGQGESMQMVADQQDILGIRLTPFYSMYLEIIKGNWEILLDKTIPFWDRAYFMVVLYGLLEENPLIGCSLIEKILENHELEQSREWELRGLDFVYFLIWNGQIEQAAAQTAWALDVVNTYHLDSFRIAVLLTQVYVSIHQSMEHAKNKLVEIESLVEVTPYLRERSHFELAKGLFFLKNNEFKSGQHCVEKGIEIMKSTKFELQLFHSVTHVCHLLKKIVGEDHALFHHYKKIRDHMYQKVEGDYLKEALKNQLHRFL